MPRYKVTRVVHEVAYIDAPDEEDAIEAMAWKEPDELHSIECPEIWAEEEA